MDKRERARLAAIDHKLAAAYGQPEHAPSGDPLGGLIRTILSQHTSDANSARAYRQLRKRFPSWAGVRDAPLHDVQAAIRSGGLANTKSRRIQQLLAELAPQGEPSLETLKDMSDADAENYLTSFHGVGPKTARCVLLFDLGRDSFPIDTHVMRVLRRVGLIGEKQTAESAHQELTDGVPTGRAHALHVNLIRHGRRRCAPRNPHCAGCPIRPHCAYGRRAPK